jgi:peptidoglycan hydrolase-like protein with peptidoglycan-binding domain
VHRWIDKVSPSLGRPFIYASPSFWKQLPASGIDQKADLWVAQWDAKSPSRVGNWPSWSFWQYSATGSVPGVNGAIDLNRFNGSLEDLHVYVTRTTAPGDAKPPCFESTTTLGLQRARNWLKVVTPPLVEDGKNGSKTKAAVKVFQRAAGLTVDGIVGERTRACCDVRCHLPRPER